MKVNLVNRGAEKALIEAAFNTFSPENEEFLPTPILNFYGVVGIGKTALIDYVEQQCRGQHILCLRINESPDALHFCAEVIRQLKQVHRSLTSEDADEKLLEQATEGLKTVVAQGSAVMLLDAVDPTNALLLEGIAMVLREVIASVGERETAAYQAYHGYQIGRMSSFV